MPSELHWRRHVLVLACRAVYNTAAHHAETGGIMLVLLRSVYCRILPFLAIADADMILPRTIRFAEHARFAEAAISRSRGRHVIISRFLSRAPIDKEAQHASPLFASSVLLKRATCFHASAKKA